MKKTLVLAIKATKDAPALYVDSREMEKFLNSKLINQVFELYGKK